MHHYDSSFGPFLRQARTDLRDDIYTKTAMEFAAKNNADECLELMEAHEAALAAKAGGGQAAAV